MDAKIRFKGIRVKTDKEGDDLFLVGFDVQTASFDDAVKIKEKTLKQLEHTLIGQKELKTE